MPDTITLPDGYNGHTCRVYTKPIEVDGNLAKLRVVGSTYLFRWCQLSCLEAAKAAQEHPDV